MTEHWYRYDDLRVADYFDDNFGVSRCRVRGHSFPVIRHTPKGVQLDHYGHRKFVLRDARKRFACPTPAEAMVSFLARKKRQRGILKAQLKHVEEAISIVERDDKIDISEPFIFTGSRP